MCRRNSVIPRRSKAFAGIHERGCGDRRCLEEAECDQRGVKTGAAKIDCQYRPPRRPRRRRRHEQDRVPRRCRNVAHPLRGADALWLSRVGCSDHDQRRRSAVGESTDARGRRGRLERDRFLDAVLAGEPLDHAQRAGGKRIAGRDRHDGDTSRRTRSRSARVSGRALWLRAVLLHLPILRCAPAGACQGGCPSCVRERPKRRPARVNS